MLPQYKCLIFEIRYRNMDGNEVNNDIPEFFEVILKEEHIEELDSVDVALAPDLSNQLSSENDCNCVIEELLMGKPFSGRNFADKLDIISKGRPTPLIPSLCVVVKNQKRLKESHYNMFPWLCGCMKISKLFCWPCLLFSTEQNTWTKTGLTNMNHLHVLKRRHELSKNHVLSEIALKQFGKTKIEFGLSEQFQTNKDVHNELVRHNRYILTRLIDVTCFLGENELSFDDHNEYANSVNQGNYVELVKLLQSSDKEFDAYLQGASVFTGVSSGIQNDLIKCVSEAVILEIKKEVLEAPFVAVILDETTDSTNKCKVSTLLRYVTKEAEVQERFVGYSDFGSGRTATALAHYVFQILKEYECEEKLIAQAYNGTASTSRRHRDLQLQMKARYSQALFVHWHSHRMNFVLRNCVDHIKECKVFFMTLSGLSTFFSKSSKRAYALNQVCVSPTRWNYNSRLVCTVMEHKNELMGLFKQIIDHRDQWDVESYNGAIGFVSTLQDFDFSFILKLFSSIFPQADLVFEILQRKISDVDYCSEKINHFESYLDELRSDYDAFWAEVMEQDTSQEQHSKRQKVENVPGERKDAYRSLYYKVIDSIKSKLNQRFSDVNKLHFIALLDSSRFQEFSLKFPEKEFACLKTCYGQYFDFARLKIELSAIYLNSQFSQDSVYELLKYLHVGDLSGILSQVYTLVSLVLTIPATSACNERSFSSLMRIKNYLCNCQTENRLPELSFLSIERALLSSLKKKPKFHEEVIEFFAKKTRIIELLYKH